MTELAMNTIPMQRSDTGWQRQLLATVSVLTLTSLFSASASTAQDTRPTTWIELGGQLERLSDGQESFAPAFISKLLDNPFTPPAKAQASPRYSIGEEGSFSFHPEGSAWAFSATVRYGRANSSGSSHEETAPASLELIISVPALDRYQVSRSPAPTKRFASTDAQAHSSHMVLDFQAGKEVGLGSFGIHGISTFNAGVRFAQFTSRSTARIDSDPDFTVAYAYRTTFAGFPAFIKIPSEQNWDLYSGKITASRSFSGIGPSLAWDANATLLGNPEVSTVTFDWGLNGALLFGRQKMLAHHETEAHHGTGRHASGALPTVYPTAVHNTARSHSVVVPNIGGFAGMSLRFPNANISLGYRVDKFFGVMDGGIDTRKNYDRDFYGPFATISIGLP